jgi:hypothetical protein
MVARLFLTIAIIILTSIDSFSFQKVDTLTSNHKEFTLETSFFNSNNVSSNGYSTSFSYLFKLNKRLELGPQIFLSSYNIDDLGKFYPIGLRGHIKFYFGDLINKDLNFFKNVYTFSKVGVAYELKDQNFMNSDQYILGFGKSIFYTKNKKAINFEIGSSEVALKRNNLKYFKNLITIGLNIRL